MHRLGNRMSGFVHESPGQQQLHALAAERTFRRHTLKAAAPRREAVALGDGADRHEADVVAVASILFAGISQPDEKQHGSPPKSSLIRFKLNRTRLSPC